VTDLPFKVTTEFKTEEIEFRAWLKNCKDTAILKEGSPAEIAHLAVMVGFDIAMVCAVLSHFRAAMQDSHIDTFAAWEAYRFDQTIHRMEKKRKGILDLSEKWERVAKLQNGEDD
jgi:hypothetical protein